MVFEHIRNLHLKGVHVKIDLIDYQSSEYKGCRFLLTYINHGIKFCFCTPIPNKEATKQDNRFLGRGSEGGRATHSPSNGGIERFNRTFEEYIAHWCDENKSPKPFDKKEQQAEEQARQEQQPQEQEDMDVVERMMAIAAAIAWLLGQWMCTVVGDVVRVPLTKEDRGKVDPIFLTCVVSEVTECNSYRVAVDAGVIKTTYGQQDMDQLRNIAPAGVGLAGVVEKWSDQAS
eukprot:jgi/Tetstr1/435943/TSEL_024824.t2